MKCRRYQGRGQSIKQWQREPFIFLFSFVFFSSWVPFQWPRSQKGEKRWVRKRSGSLLWRGRGIQTTRTFFPRRSGRYLGDAKKENIEGKIIALVSPHAGYHYSGLVAAHAYKLIEGETFETVVVVAPSHQALFKGASLYDRGGFRTPLGVVPVDVELSKKMMEKREVDPVPSRGPFQGAFTGDPAPISSGGIKTIQTGSHCDGALLELGDVSIAGVSDCRDG